MKPADALMLHALGAGVGKSDMAGQLPDSELPSSMDGTILVVAYSDKRCHGRATKRHDYHQKRAHAAEIELEAH